MATGFLVVSFFASGLLPMIEGAEDWAKIFPWHYIGASGPLVNGVDWSQMAALVGITLVLVAAGWALLVRRDILASSVDDMYATVMRQAYFVMFERTAHEAILSNKSPDDLYVLYMENLKEQFGDSVELTDEFQFEWVSIPHIYHTPFYCYAYSFGQLLVLSLYRRYQEEGEGFKHGYLRMLAHGGSRRPVQILEEAGIDITDSTFWQGGFDVIGGMIDQLEAIEL